jgi:hypothetical protein
MKSAPSVSSMAWMTTTLRVVQCRGGPRLAQQALSGLLVLGRILGKALDGDDSAESGILGLVDNAHAATADLAENPEVSEPFQRRTASRRAAANGTPAAVGAEVLHPEQERKQIADLLGQRRIPLTIVVERRPLAAALAVEELLRQRLDGVAVAAAGRGVRHRMNLPKRKDVRGHRVATIRPGTLAVNYRGLR